MEGTSPITGGQSPLANRVHPETAPVDPKTAGVAALLMQQALSQAVSKAKHTAKKLDSSAARVGTDFSPATSAPIATLSGVGTRRIW
ncbi:unnamed protein product [marine sediment metagenome]|uniref:Uncharacterized protein n=1 Tax=marine sediment metagenome TaxID=412755 RepID=X1AKM0_9ZZZZ